jgi:ribonuclease HI
MPSTRKTSASPPPGMRAVWIHADESCLGNQYQDRASPGGAAGMVEFWTGEHWERRDYWISEAGTTNNRMALRSAIEGLKALREPCAVFFISDSQYLVKGMTEWIHGWKRQQWKRKTGPVENVELWQALDREAERHWVNWAWVRGHNGHPKNEYANDLAVEAARGQTQSGGLVASGFEPWLARERAQKRRYLEPIEHLPPDSASG